MTCRACNNRGYYLERSPRTNEIIKQPCDCRFGDLDRENRRLKFWEEVIVWVVVLGTLFILYRMWV